MVTIPEKTLVKWYGDNDFGGCFIADAFTVSCEKLSDQYQKIIDNEDFQKQCDDLLQLFGKPTISFADYGEVKLAFVNINNYLVVIQCLLAHEMGKKKIVSGVKYFDEALAISHVCNYLDMPLKLFLCRELSELSSLKEYLSRSGIEYDDELCRDLFNLPAMYAFQEWVGLPQEIFLLNMRSNIGAYPFPAMTSSIARLYGDQLFAEWTEKYGVLPKKVVAPCISGSTALSIFKPLLSEEVELETVEIADEGMIEERDSYCGAFTLVRRDRKRDRIIAPEMAYLWKSGRVKRSFVSYEEAAEKMKELQKAAFTLSIESAGAVLKADNANTLVIVGRTRAGMVL